MLRAVDGCAPTRTWYWRRAVSMPGSLEADCPAGVERNLEKASLDGARMVMLRALVRLLVSSGWFWRRPVERVSIQNLVDALVQKAR